MRRHPIAALAAVTVFVSGAVLAQDEQKLPEFSPIETYTCNYKDGMDSGDFDAVVDAWNAWMDKDGDNSYWAATVTPYYYGSETFDIGWIGAWKDGASMGTGTDRWLSEGGEYAAQFAAVVDCETHSGFAVYDRGGAVRIGPVHYNNSNEINEVLDALSEILR